jgi:hypothetical protein
LIEVAARSDVVPPFPKGESTRLVVFEVKLFLINAFFFRNIAPCCMTVQPMTCSSHENVFSFFLFAIPETKETQLIISAV